MENRYFIAKNIATVATVFSVIGVIMNMSGAGEIASTFIGIGVLGAFVSYVFGGFLKAITNTLNIAKWGLVVVNFPFNLIAFLVTAILALCVMFLVPIVPVSQSAREWA